MILSKLIALIFFTLNISQVEARHFALIPFERGGDMPTAVLPPDQEVEVGAIVEISGSESSDPEEDDLAYRWSIDVAPLGSNSKIDNPSAESISFTADMEGLYILKLVVSDDESNSYPAYTAVRVLSTNMPPEISEFDFYYATIDHGTPFQMYWRIKNEYTDPDGEIVAYEFNFGDGNTTYVTTQEILSEGSGDNPGILHFYESTGNFTATLTAIDDRGARTTISKGVSIANNKLPKPVFSVNIVPNAQDSTSYDIQLDASASSDPDSTITDYLWGISGPNGSQGYNNQGTTQTHTVTAQNLGEYHIRLWLSTDSGWGNGSETSVYVGSGNPSYNTVPTLVHFVGPRVGTAPLTVNFDASSSFDIDGDTFEVFWYFGQDNENIPFGATGTTASYTYTRPGTYYGSVTVRDSHGNTNENGFSIYVKPSGDLDTGLPFFISSSDNPRQFNFSAHRSLGLIDSIPHENLFWDFGDGTKKVGGDQNHEYEREGTYLVKLSAIDISGSRKSATKYLTVRNDGGFPQMRSREIEGGDHQDVNTPVVFRHKAESATGAPIAFSYSFNDGSAIFSNILGESIPHTFTQKGFYETIAIVEEEGRAAWWHHTVYISDNDNAAPNPSFSMNKRVGVKPLTINFNASTSSDDGSISSYDWNFGDYSIPRIDMYGKGVSTGHTYENTGEHWTKVYITDNSGNVILHGAKLIILESADSTNQNPVARFTSTTNGLTVDLDASGSTDSDGKILFYDWTLGTEYIILDNDANAQHSYTFSQAGTYSVTLRVTDEDGGVHTSTQSITVTAPPEEEMKLARVPYALPEKKRVIVSPRRDFKKELQYRKERYLKHKKGGCERVQGKQHCYGSPYSKRGRG